MEFDEILRGHGQRVPIKEAEIQKYAKKVAALYKEKIALLPDHVKSSMSISRQGVLLVLCMLLFSSLFGYMGILLAQAVSDVLTGILGFLLLRRSKILL